ncbi:MAG TPA: phage head closure protein [Alphaproteobacteria bacterium]|nr:phage head closure protein [Alphaproteobacteria bacterium]
MGDMIGDMRERVTIQQRVDTPDRAGGGTESWTNVATSQSARIQPLSDSETVKAMTLSQGVTFKVRMRWRSDLGSLDDERYRLVWETNGNQVMRIIGRQNPDAQKRFLEITARIGQDEAT